MANLLSLPENLVIQHLLPLLRHNDILRLRRVSKATKALADTYLWMPKRGNQGKWELEIDSSRDGKTLQDFLQLDLPPPSQLYIANGFDGSVSEPGSFFESDDLEEFKRRYSKYVTDLKMLRLFYPFTSTKEIDFYDSLINLENLSVSTIKTVGGSAEFEKKTRNAAGSFLIRPTFGKLKTLQLDSTDCMDSMWNFINGVSDNLEEIKHPFETKNEANDSVDNSLAPVQEFIERRRFKRLVYDWWPFGTWSFDIMEFVREPMELLRVFAACHHNGVVIKNLRGCTLDCLLCNENGTIDRTKVWDQATGEMVYRVNYQRNLFVGSIIKSMIGVVDAAFLLDMSALEEITILEEDTFRIRKNHGLLQWPNLKKMNFDVNRLTEEQVHFVLERKILPSSLSELCLCFCWYSSSPEVPLRRLSNSVNCFENLKILYLETCPGNTSFFLGLWERLAQLEEVNLCHCCNLSNQCFIGNSDTPVFFQLQKLRHLSICSHYNDPLPDLTDEVFRSVFRHLKLSSFDLSMSRGTSITLEGIKELLTGKFAETIEKLNISWWESYGASEEEWDEVISRFRCSKML